MNIDDIRKESKKRILIAAHRGFAAGNIPCNSMAAYDVAINDGADIVEIDVAASQDHRLYVFHPGMEKAHLCSEKALEQMTSEEINTLRYRNYDGFPTQFGIHTLDDVLEGLKGRCCINVDKFWMNPQSIAETIRDHDMVEDVIIKTPLDEGCLRIVEKYAPDIPFMPMGFLDYKMCIRDRMKRHCRRSGLLAVSRYVRALTTVQKSWWNVFTVWASK